MIVKVFDGMSFPFLDITYAWMVSILNVNHKEVVFNSIWDTLVYKIDIQYQRL